MKQFSYKKVNAFTTENSCGNPAAFLILGEDKLTEQQMLSVAREHAGFVCEFVFVNTGESTQYKLTYYSSECEVEFCGHGTIAAMYELVKSNPILRNQCEIRFETNKKGTLTAYNHIPDEDAVYISAPAPVSYPCEISRASIAQSLGVKPENISDQYPIAVINAGLKTLLVPISDFNTEISVYPDIEVLKRFAVEQNIDIILIWCRETKEHSYFAHTRVFAPKFGYLEDPATGSGNSAFANYLHQNGLWDGSPIAIEQGGALMQFNRVMLRISDGKVLFGGSANLRIEGCYYL